MVAEGKLKTGRSVNIESLIKVQQTDSQSKNYSRSFLKSFNSLFWGYAENKSTDD